MARTYRYISGDSHLEIDSKHWIDRVPAKYRDQAPRLVRQADGSDAWKIGENIVRPAAAADLYGGKGRDEYVPFGGRYEGTPGTGSPEQRIREQDQDGIDAEVLFPSQQGGPKFWRRIEDDAAYKAVVHAYNSWLAEEYCAVDPSRLIGVGILPLTHDCGRHHRRDETMCHSRPQDRSASGISQRQSLPFEGRRSILGSGIGFKNAGQRSCRSGS